MSQIEWRPGFHDTDLVGWITFVCYLTAAGLCFRAAKRLRDDPDDISKRRERRFWYALSLLLLLLGINKQLDLQTFMTDVGRGIAKAEGWYNQRRQVQAAFIAFLVVINTAALLTLGVLMRRGHRRHWLALAGVALLVTYVLIRAASFHHVDRVLGVSLAGIKLHWLLELCGIACIGVSTWPSLR